jgi:ABC-type phosphate/phosphonate transport system permease subunit
VYNGIGDIGICCHLVKASQGREYLRTKMFHHTIRSIAGMRWHELGLWRYLRAGLISGAMTIASSSSFVSGLAVTEAFATMKENPSKSAPSTGGVLKESIALSLVNSVSKLRASVALMSNCIPHCHVGFTGGIG